MKPKIVIWGADNYNTLGLLRQLANNGFSLCFANTGTKQFCASVSRYCEEYLEIPVNNEAIDELISLKRDCTIKDVLIPSGDLTAEEIDKNRERLLPYFHLTGTTMSGLLSKVDNKEIMVNLAKKHGFIVPKSHLFSKNLKPPCNLQYPIILKPIYSQNGIVEFKFKILQSIQELEKFRELLNPNNSYLIQEYVPKEKDILVYGVRLYNGEVILAGQYIKDRWSDDGGGSHGRLTGSIPHSLNPKGIISFLAEIDYYGLFSIEYGLLKDKVFFYEFNLRNDGTSHLFFQAGANLPLKWILNCFNQSSVTVPTKIRNEHWNINEIYDISNVFAGRVKWSKYREDKKSADVFHYYDKDDLMPWKIARLKAIYDVPFRVILKKFRPHLVHLLYKLKYGRQK